MVVCATSQLAYKNIIWKIATFVIGSYSLEELNRSENIRSEGETNIALEGKN